jgi:hypothetical protein
MIIDMHTHVGDLRRPDTMDRTPVTFDNLIARLDDEGIDKAVLLPMGVNAEGVHFGSIFDRWPDTASQIREGMQHKDRLILFGNVDPRAGGNLATTDFSWVFERFVAMGCVGIGEVTANLESDDPRVVNFFRQCGAWHLPVTIHGYAEGAGSYGLTDTPGSPRLERLLQQVPETIVFGHGQGFWAEIAGDVTLADKAGYARSVYTEEGSLWRLMRAYPNLHCDMSAGSGHNALTRNAAQGVCFINEFQDRIVFATDVCFGDVRGRMPHLATLRRLLAEGSISQAVFDKLTYQNARRILGV